MTKESFRPGGAFAVLIAAAVIVIAGILYRNDIVPQADRTDPLDEESAVYLKEEELLKAAQAGDELIERQLKDAFDAGELFPIVTYDVPKTENKLVLAAPTKSGTDEFASCGVDGQAYCGLYLQTPTSSRLLMWGSALAGFESVSEFVDSNHAVVSSAWSLFNYTSIERKQLNLDNGELLPLLLLELDSMDNGAELLARGNGAYAKLVITGSYEQGRTYPSDIRIEDERGNSTFRMDKTEVAQFADAQRVSEQVLPSVFLEPQDDDIRTYAVRLRLFGMEYLFDVRKNILLKTAL